MPQATGGHGAEQPLPEHLTVAGYSEELTPAIGRVASQEPDAGPQVIVCWWEPAGEHVVTAIRPETRPAVAYTASRAS